MKTLCTPCVVCDGLTSCRTNIFYKGVLKPRGLCKPRSYGELMARGADTHLMRFRF